jgi:soluble lytic murein transglycosylase-like protein
MKLTSRSVVLTLGYGAFLALGCLPVQATAVAESAPVPHIRMEGLPAAAQWPTTLPAKPTPATGPQQVTRLFPHINQASTAALSEFILRYNRKLSAAQAFMMAEAILGISQNWQVDYRLVTAVVAVESSFRTDAISSSGAIGLGQLKPKTAEWLGVANPFDPLDNLGGTTKYIRFLLNRYPGNLDAAIAAYFQGQGFVDRNGVTDICKTYLHKVNKVLSLM